MSDTKTAALLSVINKQLDSASTIFQSLESALAFDVPKLGKTGNAAIMVAGLIENYYTCLETAFHKISQYFENNLDPAHWHSDLLEKMALRLEGIRIPAVSEAGFRALQELQRFRHFKRYYFEQAYDWDRLDYLTKKLREAHPIALADLRRFMDFVRSL